MRQAAETRIPSPVAKNPPQMSQEEKIAFITTRMREVIEVLGLDITHDSLKETPERIAKMYVNEIFSGLNLDAFPEIKFFPADVPGALVTTKVSFTSFCEHHFVPMTGVAHVAYLPKDKLIGLSKVARIVRYFAKRPQLQERLTAQIGDSLAILLDSEDVAVSITATHFCVIARGVEDGASETSSQLLRGQFRTNPSLREEFFASLCHSGIAKKEYLGHDGGRIKESTYEEMDLDDSSCHAACHII